MNETDPDKTGPYVPPADTPAVPFVAPTVEDANTPSGERFGGFVLTAEPRKDGDLTRTEAWQIGLGRVVTITRPTPDAPPETALGLRRQATVAAKFAHPGVLPVAEAGELDGVPYLVTVAADGETLAERMAKGNIPERVAARWAVQMVETLFHAHDAGVVHGNLRPEFVHLGLDGRVRLDGFGSAPPDLEHDDYQPPRWRNESAVAKPADDVYALGVMLWKCVTGKSPDEPSRLASRDLKEICDRTVRHGYGYGQRRPTVPLLTDLRRFLAHKPLRYEDGPGLRTARRWMRRNRRAVLWGLLVAVALGVTWGTDDYRRESAWEILFRQDSSPEERAFVAGEFRDLAKRDWGSPEIIAGLNLAEGKEAEAKTTFGSRREYWYNPKGSTTPPADSLAWRINERFGRKEEDTFFRNRPDRVAEAIRAARPWTASAIESPREQDNVIARGQAALRAAEPWLSDPAVLTALAERFFEYAEANRLLTMKAPGWETRPEARAALPALIPQAGRHRIGDNRVTTDENTLARIDPDWPKNPVSRAAIPALILESAIADWADPNETILKEWRRNTLARIDPDWPRSREARTAVSKLIIWLGRYKSQDAELERRQTAVLATLRLIDPQWQTFPEAAAGADELVRVIERYEPSLVARYNPARSGIVPPRGPNEAERVIDRREWYADAQRAVDVLRLLGPAAAPAKRLENWLDHPDPVYRGLIALAVSRAKPDWLDSPAGRTAVEELVKLAAYPNPSVSDMAKRTLNRLPLTQPDPRVTPFNPLADVLIKLTSTDPVIGLQTAQRFDAGWVGVPLTQAAVPGLIRWLAEDVQTTYDTKHFEHRQALVGLLDRIDPDWRGTPAAKAGVVALKERLLKPSKPESRWLRGDGTLAAETLTWFGKGPLTGDVRSALSAGLRGDNVLIQHACLHALKTVGPDDPMVADLLPHLAGHPRNNEEVNHWDWSEHRRHAMEVLNKLPDWRLSPAVSAAVPGWVNLAKSDDMFRQRDAAKRAMNEAAGPKLAEAVPFLAECLMKNSPFRGYEAVSILEKLGPAAKPAAPALLHYLLTSDDDGTLIRKAAAVLRPLAPNWAHDPATQQRLKEITTALTKVQELTPEEKRKLKPSEIDAHRRLEDKHRLIEGSRNQNP